MNYLLQWFYLYCQLIETIYMDCKTAWIKYLNRPEVDEYLPF